MGQCNQFYDASITVDQGNQRLRFNFVWIWINGKKHIETSVCHMVIIKSQS